ncbi:MAG: serine protease [Desulfuromonadaceae bacterium]|nr:serine protease [Desulfuromonadaceae bacterium]MDD2856316.1 serine protease [Desulfuromonadaceae bacterium]
MAKIIFVSNFIQLSRYADNTEYNYYTMAYISLMIKSYVNTVIPGLLGSVFLFCFLVMPTSVYADEIKFETARSIVKIYVVKNQYNYHEPWQKIGVRQYQGSGSIISGKRILTSAHVVSDQTFIQVRRSGIAKKYTANVESIEKASDLAILSVDDPDFFDGSVPLEIGTLPFVRDKVAVYGYPDGGDTLSITEGVVSRIEHQEYIYSNTNLLACQIDAPINSGNSGGPAIVNKKLVGVVFQGLYGPTTENIGYMVPTPVILHFLNDISDNTLDGIPELGISMQKMENPSLRKKFGISGKKTGVLVNKIYPESPAKGLLLPNDVIIAIDGELVENDGTILFRQEERTFLGYLWQKKQIGESISVTVLRGDKNIVIEIILSKSIGFERLVPHKQYDIAPSYYIVGGLVFAPLTRNYLEEYGTEQNWALQAPKELLSYYLNGEPTTDHREILLLINVLADDINIGYHAFTNGIINRVNGHDVATLEDLVEAFETNKEEFHTIEDVHGYRIVLDRIKSVDRNKTILKRYLVPAGRSKDLVERQFN